MKRRPQSFGLVLASFGLVLLAAAALIYLLLDRREQDNTTQATDFSAAPAPVRYAAPSLSLKDLDGRQHALADYRGQVVLVNLWATWCPPCKAEMPLLQDFYGHHAAEGFTVIAIEDGDPAEDVRAFVKQYGLTFPVWLDPTYQATEQAFKTMNLPSSYVIDRTGTVRLFWLGAINAGNLDRYIIPIIRER